MLSTFYCWPSRAIFCILYFYSRWAWLLVTNSKIILYAACLSNQFLDVRDLFSISSTWDMGIWCLIIIFLMDSPIATRTQAILSPRNSASLGSNRSVACPFSVLISIFCRTVIFCLQLSDRMILSTTSICMWLMGGSLGNSLIWKWESEEWNSFSRPLRSWTLLNVSLRVVLSWRLLGGSVNFIIFSSYIGRLSSSSSMVFFTSWGWVS